MGRCHNFRERVKLANRAKLNLFLAGFIMAHCFIFSGSPSYVEKKGFDYSSSNPDIVSSGECLMTLVEGQYTIKKSTVKSFIIERHRI